MWRRPATGGDIIHIWRDDPPTITYCGYVGEARAGRGPWACLVCVRAYGQDLDDAFPHVEWLHRDAGATKHAFEPDANLGWIRPVCDIRPYRVWDLAPNELVQRCPHCVGTLRDRARRNNT